jgi:NADPH:quinone reductase-like Zn-dependent oxidoreductase
MLQVCAVTRGGAFAEEVCVNEGGVLKVPPSVDLISAAGILLTLEGLVPILSWTCDLADAELLCYTAATCNFSSAWTGLC